MKARIASGSGLMAMTREARGAAEGDAGAVVEAEAEVARGDADNNSKVSKSYVTTNYSEEDSETLWPSGSASDLLFSCRWESYTWFAKSRNASCMVSVRGESRKLKP